jgi:hypothetical protein
MYTASSTTLPEERGNIYPVGFIANEYEEKGYMSFDQ